MTANRLHFQDTPSLLSQYGRALLSKGQKGQVDTLPDVQAWQTGIIPNAKKVAAYSQVCGFEASNSLPLTYPHILAFPLHMELMLHKDFPLALMGLVHIRNRVVQHRAISLQDKLDICCSFANPQNTDKGFEFDIRTEITSAGELLWESTSTNLQRKAAKKSQGKRTRPEPLVYSTQERWNLAANLGRRYARVSGDSNPIHLFSVTAKLFGFKQHIAHGMWSKARIAATLAPYLQGDKIELVTDFKLPVFLPSQVELHWNEFSETATASTEFELRNIKGDKTHVAGSISALNQ